MRVRLAEMSDAAAMARVHAASFLEPWGDADFAVWLARREAFAIIGEADGRAAAFGLALAAGEDAELLSIATLPAARGRGWGGQVLAALNTEAARRELSRWVLEVARTNVPALALYRSQGFMEIGVRRAYYPEAGGRTDALVLARPVGRESGLAPG